MKKLFLLFLAFFLCISNAFADDMDDYRQIDEGVLIKKEVLDIYDNYMEDLQKATSKAFKKHKFNNFGMKFGAWRAEAFCLINKEGIIENFYISTEAEIRKKYALINGEYIETNDWTTKDEFLTYSSYDLLPHPLREKAYFKYRFEFFDHVKNFIINDMPKIPFPEGIQHENLYINLRLYYFPFDPIRYYYGTIVTKLNDEYVQSGQHGIPKYKQPPAWVLIIARK